MTDADWTIQKKDGQQRTGCYAADGDWCDVWIDGNFLSLGVCPAGTPLDRDMAGKLGNVLLRFADTGKLVVVSEEVESE